MDDAPGTFDSSFKGQQAESGGVMGMLEVIASDFARLESDTTAAEDQGAAAEGAEGPTRTRGRSRLLELGNGAINLAAVEVER